MFLKVIAIIAFIGACQAEHAYSSQSFIRFDNRHDHHDVQNEYHGIPNHEQEQHIQGHLELKDHVTGNPKLSVVDENKTDLHEHVKPEYIEHKPEHHEHKIEHKFTHHENKVEHKPAHHITKVEYKPNHLVKITEHETELQEKQEENQFEQEYQSIHKPEYHEKKVKPHTLFPVYYNYNDEKQKEQNEKINENNSEQNEKNENHKTLETKVEHRSELNEYYTNKPIHTTEHKHAHKIEHIIEHTPYNEKKHEPLTDHTEKNQEEQRLQKHEEPKNNLHLQVVSAIVKHDGHIPIIAQSVTPKAIAVAEYVHKSTEDHQQQHELATSYQHISRHDVPGPPPKDFIDYTGPTKYEFAYTVKDSHTGDNKSQHEAHDGHNLKGVYSLHQPDGSVRTVEYASDKHAGFSANVKHLTKHVDEKHHP